MGVVCTEYEVSASDQIAEVQSALRQDISEYQVVKIPVGSVGLQLAVQELGFLFFETNMQLEKKITEKPLLPKQYTRFQNNISYRDATAEEIEQILKEVAEGHMFTTDKVAVDPYFSPKHAGVRYALWAKDILDKGARTVLGLYKGEVASFTIYEDKGKYYQAFIGGMLKEYRDRGLGFIPLFVTAAQIYDTGGGVLRTGVSSNNPAILRLQLLFGSQIVGMTNVFIKHL